MPNPCCQRKSPQLLTVGWGYWRTVWRACCSSTRWNWTWWAAFEIDEESLRRLRAESVKNVRQTNGRLSLEQRMRREGDL